MLFIKKYAMSALGLSTPLNENDFLKIIEFSMDCEMNVFDDDGNDLPNETLNECDLLGADFGTEISIHADENIDLENLNSRLLVEY